MTDLEKVLFLADMIEPGRDFRSREITPSWPGKILTGKL